LFFSQVCLALSLATLLLAFTAAGQVPLIGGGNEDLSSSLHISNPVKLWAIHAVLENGTAHYFDFDLKEGARIHLELLKSTDPEDEGFLPKLLLIGPGIEDKGSSSALQPEGNASSPFASSVAHEALKGLGVLEAEGREEKATYEPFWPSSRIKLAEINISAPRTGRYYAVVYESNKSSRGENASMAAASAAAEGAAGGKGGGHYSLAVGYREEFSFTDRMIAPIRIASVYIWEGQSLTMILIPYLVAIIAGFLIYWRSSRRSPFSLAGTLAGFLFLGTSSLILTQMVFSLTRAPFGPEIYITMATVLFHAILGVASIRLARGEAGILQRSLLAVIGTIALLGGSGMILGPILGIAASFLPTARRGPASGDLLSEG